VHPASTADQDLTAASVLTVAPEWAGPVPVGPVLAARVGVGPVWVGQVSIRALADLAPAGPGSVAPASADPSLVVLAADTAGPRPSPAAFPVPIAHTFPAARSRSRRNSPGPSTTGSRRTARFPGARAPTPHPLPAARRRDRRTSRDHSALGSTPRVRFLAVRRRRRRSRSTREGRARDRLASGFQEISHRGTALPVFPVAIRPRTVPPVFPARTRPPTAPLGIQAKTRRGTPLRRATSARWAKDRTHPAGSTSLALRTASCSTAHRRPTWRRAWHILVPLFLASSPRTAMPSRSSPLGQRMPANSRSRSSPPVRCRPASSPRASSPRASSPAAGLPPTVVPGGRGQVRPCPSTSTIPTGS
jgi:hypothetical protein